MKRCIIVLFIALFMNIIAGCANSADNQPSGKTVTGRGKLAGSVMRGPTSAAVKGDMPSPSEPAPDIKLAVLTMDGKEITFVATNAKGVYSVSLPSGSYRIETTSYLFFFSNQA
jgi:hypothetical protein